MTSHEFLRLTLIEHLNLGSHKAVSYLPIATITDVLNINVSRFVALGSSLGLSHMLTSAERSCIRSGSLHFYDSVALSQMLKDRSWKSDLPQRRRARVFVRRISRTWFLNDDPIAAIIQLAFGGQMQLHANYPSPSAEFIRKVDDFVFEQGELYNN